VTLFTLSIALTYLGLLTY